jgi:hypothetical protein
MHITIRQLTGFQIVLEALLGLALGTIGACLNAPPLKEISWASEMRKQYGLYTSVPHRSMPTVLLTKWMQGKVLRAIALVSHRIKP